MIKFCIKSDPVAAGSRGDLPEETSSAAKEAAALCREETLSTKPKTLVLSGEDSAWMVMSLLKTPDGGLGCLQSMGWKELTHLWALLASHSQMTPVSGQHGLRAHPAQLLVGALKIVALCFRSRYRIGGTFLWLLLCSYLSFAECPFQWVDRYSKRRWNSGGWQKTCEGGWCGWLCLIVMAFPPAEPR